MVGKVVETEVPLTVARRVVAVPMAWAVKVAVYVPLPLSVVAERAPVEVPPVFEKTTVAPPEMRAFP